MTDKPGGQRSDDHQRLNKRMAELFQDPPEAPGSPTIWAFPQMVGFMKVAGQPVAGPWPPHQQPRPDPDDESLPVAIVEPDERAPRHDPREES